MLKLMVSTPSSILVELAVRSFVGSRDIPKDHLRSINLLDFAEKQAKSEKEKHEVKYYKLLLQKQTAN